MEPKRLAARAAVHLNAIKAARQAGYLWQEIATRLGVPSGTALRRVCERARKYQPERQLPLPGSQARPETAQGKPKENAEPGTTPPAAPSTRPRITNPAELRQARRVDINPDDYQE